MISSLSLASFRTRECSTVRRSLFVQRATAAILSQWPTSELTPYFYKDKKPESSGSSSSSNSSSSSSSSSTNDSRRNSRNQTSTTDRETRTHGGSKKRTGRPPKNTSSDKSELSKPPSSASPPSPPPSSKKSNSKSKSKDDNDEYNIQEAMEDIHPNYVLVLPPPDTPSCYLNEPPDLDSVTHAYNIGIPLQVHVCDIFYGTTEETKQKLIAFGESPANREQKDPTYAPGSCVLIDTSPLHSKPPVKELRGFKFVLVFFLPALTSLSFCVSHFSGLLSLPLLGTKTTPTLLSAHLMALFAYSTPAVNLNGNTNSTNISPQ
jgi:hypothetical protein